MKKEISKFKKAIVLISVLTVIFAANFSVAEKVSAATDTTSQSSQLEQAINVDQGAAGATQAQALQSAGLQDNSYDQALISTGNTGNTEIPNSYVGTGGGIGKSTDANPNGATIPDNQKTVRSLGVVGNAIVYVAKSIMVASAGLMDFALKLGSDVINLDSVRTAWGIVLNVTNLGFVLAIIVIAFATIFRKESYGMKKTLWKLVVAALLVNFSLVIAGGIIDASNTVTGIFTQATLGSNGSNLSVALGNALKPQALGDVSGASNSSWTDWVSNPLKAAYNLLSSLIFVIIFTFLMVLAFLALFVMFLMRALYLIILLILSPIVWLLWIFPDTSKYFKQWWSSFIRWNVFAPAVLFFIYVAVMTAAAMQKTTLQSISQSQATANSAAAALNAQTLISPQGGFFNYSAQLFVILGLLFGGIYVANKLGLEGGKVGMGIASWAGKGVGSWAGRKGSRLGTLPQRSKYGQKAIEGLQKYGANWNGTQRFFGGAFIANRLGHGLSAIGVQQGESLVKKAEDRQKGLTNMELAARLPSMTREEKVAALKKLTKDKDLDMVSNLASYIKDPGTEKLFASYGQGKFYGDMEKTAGFNTAMLSGKDKDGKEVSFDTAKEKFRASYSTKDYDKLQEHVFKKEESDPSKNPYGLGSDFARIGGASRETLFEQHPGAISKVRAKLKGSDLNDFQRALDTYVRAEETKIIGDNIESVEEMTTEVDGIKKTGKVKVSVPTARATVKEKLKWIDTNRPNQKDKMNRLYNASKNLGGSLLGDYSFINPEGTTEETTT